MIGPMHVMIAATAFGAGCAVLRMCAGLPQDSELNAVTICLALCVAVVLACDRLGGGGDDREWP